MACPGRLCATGSPATASQIRSGATKDERLNPPDQVATLRLVCRLVDAGHRPGTAIGRSAEDLSEFCWRWRHRSPRLPPPRRTRPTSWSSRPRSRRLGRPPDWGDMRRPASQAGRRDAANSIRHRPRHDGVAGLRGQKEQSQARSADSFNFESKPITFSRKATVKKFVFQAWNYVFDHNVSPLRHIPDVATRHMILQILGWMWVVSFSIAVGSYTFFAVSIVGHVALISAIAITVATYTAAEKKPSLFASASGRRSDGEHE